MTTPPPKVLGRAPVTDQRFLLSNTGSLGWYCPTATGFRGPCTASILRGNNMILLGITFGVIHLVGSTFPESMVVHHGNAPCSYPHLGINEVIRLAAFFKLVDRIPLQAFGVRERPFSYYILFREHLEAFAVSLVRSCTLISGGRPECYLLHHKKRLLHLHDAIKLREQAITACFCKPCHRLRAHGFTIRPRYPDYTW